jgi:dipeptidyl-peptidase-4
MTACFMASSVSVYDQFSECTLMKVVSWNKWKLLVSFLCVCSITPLISQEKKRLTFEQIFLGAGPHLSEPLPACRGWKDDTHYLLAKQPGGGVVSVDEAHGQETPYHDLSAFKGIADSSISLNAPETVTEDWSVAAYRIADTLYVLNTHAKTFKRLLAGRGEIQNPLLSPDGRYVAFTRHGDLYAIETDTGRELRCTHDGSDVIYNGWASWVYYEEILGRESRYRAFWWSPDSRRIALYRFDDTHVPVYPLFDNSGVHGTEIRTHYPQPGDPNPQVRIGFVDMNNGIVTWSDFNANDDQYFGKPYWTPDSKQLLVQWMDRPQKNLKIVAVNPLNGTRYEIYHDRQETWVDWIEDLVFLKDGFVMLSDADGWMHAYLYGMDGRLRQRLTSGPWSVTAINRVDEVHGRVLFSARKEESTRTDLYSVSFNGTGLLRLTSGDFSNDCNVSPTGRYFITTYSNIQTPGRMALCDSSGRIVRELADSRSSVYGEYTLAHPELLRVTTDDGYSLPVSITLPFDFDTTKRYPVLISVYGGPDGGTVHDRWGGIGNQWLAMEGVIQVAMDHRGSGHFGKKGVALMYRSLGRWEMHDYIEVAKWLRAKSYVDTNRICITGASYGGYVACMGLTEGSRYFSYGLALFPVTDWRLYDTHYTERYMGTPAENPEGYCYGSVIAHAPQYRGLLKIVHGTTDDNVHLQNTLQLIDTLENLGKHVELVLYPNQKHGWRAQKGDHLRDETYRFYYETLIRKPFPQQLFEEP